MSRPRVEAQVNTLVKDAALRELHAFIEKAFSRKDITAKLGPGWVVPDYKPPKEKIPALFSVNLAGRSYEIILVPKGDQIGIFYNQDKPEGAKIKVGKGLRKQRQSALMAAVLEAAIYYAKPELSSMMMRETARSFVYNGKKHR
jgi:hypothetical protein